MSPHKFFRDLGAALEANQVADSPSGGTLGFVPECAFQHVVMKSSGSESRVLPPAAEFPTGATALLICDTAGSSISVTQPGSASFDGINTTLAFSTNGSFCTVNVTPVNGTKRWRLAKYQDVTPA